MTAVQVQYRRGTSTQIASFTGAAGELAVDTTNNRVVVQDGSTAGGFAAAKLSEVATLGGALGTPSSGTLTNCSGLPVGGVTGLGTGVATALADAVDTSGGVLRAPATNNAHGVLIAEGSGSQSVTTAAMTNGQLLVGQTSADPLPKTVSGDATLSAAGALTVTKTNGTAFGALATVTPGTGVATALANNTNASGGIPTVPVANAQLANSAITINGKSVSLGGSYAPIRVSAIPTNPLGTTNTSGVMAGLAVAFTPAATGNILFHVTGDLSNGTSGGGAGAQLRYGTGTAPANGAASTGTPAGALVEGQLVGNPLSTIPFALVAYVPGFTVGTPYWFDLMQLAVTSGTVNLAQLTITIIEL